MPYPNTNNNINLYVSYKPPKDDVIIMEMHIIFIICIIIFVFIIIVKI